MNTKTTNTLKVSIAILISMISAYTFIYLTKNCFSSAMVFIVEEGILTKFQTGTINAVFYAVYAVAQMAVAPIVDKFRPERFITIGLAGAAVSNFAIYLNQNYILILCVWGCSMRLCSALFGRRYSRLLPRLFATVLWTGPSFISMLLALSERY